MSFFDPTKCEDGTCDMRECNRIDVNGCKLVLVQCRRCLGVELMHEKAWRMYGQDKLDDTMEA